MSAENINLNGAATLRREILAMITRYGQESDISWYQILGTLEVVKSDVIEQMTKNKI